MLPHKIDIGAIYSAPPADHKKYKLFEPGLTKANSTTPCPELGYPTYDSTVTHGAGPIKMTLDLYDPANPATADSASTTA